MVAVDRRVPTYMYPANCTVPAHRRVRIDIRMDDAAPFLSGKTESDAEKTIARGIAHEAAKRHMNGVMTKTDGMG